MATAPERAPRLSGAALNAFLLAAFIIAKSLVTILLAECGAREGGYPFVLQSILLPPFGMQIVFYAGQACCSLGLADGLRALARARHAMLPAVFYSLMVSGSMLLQTLSQNYLDESTFVVLMQLTLVFVAVGERCILHRRSSPAVWSLVVLQVFFVSLYEMPTGNRATAVEQDGAAVSDWGSAQAIVGAALCLLAGVCSAIGSILQQKFLQSAGSTLPTSIKLFYQHIIGFVLMVVTTLGQPSARDRLWRDGMFYGWDRMAALTSACMWLSFLTASAVTANISAMAGAMGAAVVVIVVGCHNVLVNGKELSLLQAGCILAIASITAAYTYIKSMLSSKFAKEDDQWPPSSSEKAIAHAHVSASRARVFPKLLRRKERALASQLFEV